jgi:hypothetical protein
MNQSDTETKPTKLPFGKSDSFTTKLQFLLAIAIVGPKKLSERLWKEASRGADLGDLIICILTLVPTCIWVGVTAAAATDSAIIGGGLGFLLTILYLFPAAYAYAIKPGWRAGRNVWRKIETALKGNAETIALAGLSVFRALPGSDLAWVATLTCTDESWFVKTLNAIVKPVLVMSIFYTGWLLFSWSAHLAFATGILGFAIKYLVFLVGLGFACFVFSFGRVFLHAGKLPALALLTGAILGIDVLLWFVKDAPYLALTGGLATMVVFTAWLFPCVDIASRSGLLLKVALALKALNKQTYDREARPFTKHFLHGVNIALAAVVFCLFGFIVHLAMPLWVAGLSAFVVAAASYGAAGKAANTTDGPVSFSVTLAVLVGGAVTVGYLKLGLPVGVYGAIFAFVVTLLAMLFIAFPIVFTKAEGVAAHSAWLAAVGDKFVALHGFYDDMLFEPVAKTCRDIYGWYRLETTQKKTAIHFWNITIAWMIAGAALWELIEFAPQSGTVAHVAFAAASLLLGILSYLLLGKRMLKEGLEMPGFIVSVWSAFFISKALATIHPLGWWLAVPVAFCQLTVSYWLLFPATFKLATCVFGDSSNAFLLFLFERCYAWSWRQFQDFYDGFKKMYRAVVQWLTPYWAMIALRYREIQTWASGLWTKVFGA